MAERDTPQTADSSADSNAVGTSTASLASASLPMPWPPNWPNAWPCTGAKGTLKSVPDDFKVNEEALVEPCGEGEHIWLRVEKTGANTAWIASRIAEIAGVREMDVGYAGLKDRHAVTQQWFSIYLPPNKIVGNGPDFSLLNSDESRLLLQTRHSKKLRPGELKANHFEIRIRDVEGDQGKINDNLEHLRQDGYPNYFGLQRFGHDGGNIPQGIAMLRREIRVRNRKKKGLYLSSIRSMIFNEVLANRVRAGNWNQVLPGDCLSDAGLPTGPLWGRGRSAASEQALDIEQAALVHFDDILDALEHAGLSQERRSLVVKPERLEWQWELPEAGERPSLRVRFSLSAGYYATSLLAEVMTLSEPIRLAGASEATQSLPDGANS